MRQPSLVAWTALRDLGAVAALLGRDRTELEAQLSMLPDGLEGVALVSGEEPCAVGVYVRSNLPATGRCSLTWLSSRDPADALELVRRMEERARAEGARTLEVAERRVNDLAPLIGAAGYARVNAMLHMRRTRRRGLPSLPEGIAERTLSEAGMDAWVHAEHEAFRGVAFTVLLTREDAERQRAAPGFDEPLLRILVDADGPLGMLRGLMSPDGTGEVESIGLDARARRRGLGRWLLRRCEELLDARGAREVVLRVAESNAVAVGLYRREGYEEVRRDVAWERGL
ncbi:MAG TPA: GNAT family N-acetyltransferase [Anaeromyxobacteraceae bacterium]|nr:GNAT family N-acetyltransferase [Anaeromyxobacteraceae bacterium]